ncbi:hypothetical protein PR202_gb26374 [Eleusine coracana subsp. coracana]|uniref:Importin subunit alpha n=1 Tax=Eleusine coracana subsp. coracana TaxID=191504 RepID=A0AAV5FR02_ELECO|nr:hypothetical protein PR202_gb26374 [Eleusine coracana subsp. coracana]
MADGSPSASPSSASPNQHHHRGAIKSSVHNSAASRRREQAIAIGKERREALMRAKRVCRAPLSGSDEAAMEEGDMVINEEKSDLDARTAQAVEDLKSALSSHNNSECVKTLIKDLNLEVYLLMVPRRGKGAQKKKTEVLRALRRLLSQSEVPPVEAAIKAGVVPLLVQYLSFGSSDEQKSSTLVAEQCAWAIGNVAGEGSELRNKLLSQGALLPLARLMLSNKGSTARTAAWALSNLIKGPDPMAANELISVDGVLNTIIRNLEKADEELATEVAWVVVYISALSEKAVGLIVRSSVPQLLIGRLLASENLQLLIPEASWAMSNIAAGSFEHKKLIFASEAPPLLIHLLTTAQFDIRREAAYTLGNLCVVPAGNALPPNIIVDHLVAIVNGGALPGFINLVRSADIESARIGLQFLELVMRGYPNGQGPKLVEKEDGIEAMERFQFHENEVMRNMANGLVDKYFGEDYGLE